jgi:cell division protein FtsB
MSFFKSLFSKQFLFTLVLLGLLVLISFPLSKNWRQKRSIDKEIQELELQAKELEGKNNNLKNVLDYMQSDQFVEKEARTKLNYKKPGESVVVIEGRPGETLVTETSPFEVLPEPPKTPELPATINFNKWLDYFFAVK